MFIGSMAAVLYFKKSKYLYITKSFYTLLLCMLLILLFIFIPIEEITNYIGLDPIFAFIGHPSIHGILTSCIILFSIQAKADSNFLENKIIRYLGKISYGLYVFHPIVLIILYLLPNTVYEFNWALQYLFVISLTILFSSISYKYFESWFLKYKNKFSTIISGDNSI